MGEKKGGEIKYEILSNKTYFRLLCSIKVLERNGGSRRWPRDDRQSAKPQGKGSRNNMQSTTLSEENHRIP